MAINVNHVIQGLTRKKVRPGTGREAGLGHPFIRFGEENGPRVKPGVTGVWWPGATGTIKFK
jgi:hypothetical protein